MTKKRTIANAVIALVIAYLVTCVGLFAFAFVLYRFQLGNNAIELGVMAIYILSTAIGGFYLGRKMEIRRFLWGFMLGFLYVCILACVSVAFKGDTSGVGKQGITSLLLCLAGGTLGGMLS